MTEPTSEMGVLKTLWRRNQAGRWAIHDMKGLALKPKPGFDPGFFIFESEFELLTSSPASRSFLELVTSFGSTDFLLKQSVVPVVALVEGENIARCIGTGFVISCTGYVITACHVLLDPQDSGYGRVSRIGDTLRFLDGLSMGVLIPLNPAYGHRGYFFLPFEKCRYWGEWRDSPLIHEPDRIDIHTDIAICKVPPLPADVAHQPLNLSLNSFVVGEKSFALGYAEMMDIPLQRKEGRIVVPDATLDLYVSVGEVMHLFPDNLQRKEVPTPGPCFDFRARVPGKMSGGPIFGGDGAVVRGVVSRSFSGEKHAFGAMLGPVMRLLVTETQTLKDLMESGNEGIVRIQGAGL
ncbi:MAG TPA: trypsin-like peptidase domain-containing protein [Xanthomonadaceae bacterium]|nr:trypsin-like peptidase domain-containing protein [Xanthomonadaceae bacterium]